MTPLRRLTARLGRALRGDSGTSTVEFVIVVPLLFSLFLMSVEVSVMMTRQMLLNHAMDVTMRGVRLGKYPSLTHDKLRDLVCSQMKLVTNCTDVMKIELTPVSKTAWDFPAAPVTCVDRSETVQPVTTFDQGLDSSLMLVRACVVIDPFFPGVGLGLRLTEMRDDGGYALQAVSAFVNEPGAGA